MMSYLPRRLLHTTLPHLSSSTTKPHTAQEACSELLTRFSTSPISTRHQILDANQLHLLQTTLTRTPTSYTHPKPGTPIPPGYHLVYFTPSILESELGRDGTDRTVNPLAPFTRRMWAGGELEWNERKDSGLKVGQEVQETTRLVSAEAKTMKNGGEMLVVGVEKEFENEFGVAVKDGRNWVFQREFDIAEAKPPLERPATKPFPGAEGEGVGRRDFTQTAVSLFRFSALTFNAHKIHFSREWCREVEGHRDAVVHGPLNLINMLDLWRDTVRDGAEDAVPKSIAYRAMSPLYMGEQYRILLNREGEGKWKAEIWDGFGKLGMRGSIVG
ncbi:hypothetical protein P280DRAFT_462007 [Massarina eburnea CBS 473.64]|uniref:N-terminal of MaoC-like dehydratase domain-containing protein n=1 Tax=Massarina eburnea CBS 473.64 TaxID=1395130 RepID=A0A6A6RJ39_9PLEO|nr:hypothetical protein P280DRAFT_462007 [Massarina eburnea CBS 473.64]